MIMGRCRRSTTAIVIGEPGQQITATIATAAIAGSNSCRLLVRPPRPLSFPPLLLSLTPPRPALPMSSSPSPSPPPSERRDEATNEEKREGAPASVSSPPAASDLPAAAAAAAAPPPPPPPPPEMPLPGDCCGSGCVRCVWDVYYEELEAYNKLIAERGTETKKPD